MSPLRCSLSATLFLLSINAVHAWQGEDPSKRADVLPFVRAATDCIAKAVLSNPSAMQAARAGQWRQAVRIIGKACDHALGLMVLEHDRVYGKGAGWEFLSGAYNEDVARAVERRVSPLLQTVSKEPETQPPFDANLARKALSALNDEHWTCLVGALKQAFPRSTAEPQVLAREVMARCSGVERKRIQAGASLFGISPEQSAMLLTDKLVEMHRLLTLHIAILRAGKKQAERSA